MKYRNGSKLAKIAQGLSCLLALSSLTAGSWSVQAQTPRGAFGASTRLAKHTASQVLDGTATRVNHYDPQQTLRLVLAVQPPHMVEEEQFLVELQTKGNRNFHKFLTPEEWNARFAPSVEDEQKVVEWAQSQGLTVTHRYNHRLLVDLEAPAGVIEKVFGVTINNYQVGDEVDFANDQDPILPESLSGLVYSVQGLNNIQRDHGSNIGAEKIKGEDYVPGPVVSAGVSDHKDADPDKGPAGLLADARPIADITNKRMDPTDLYSSQTYNYAGLQPLSHCCNVHNDSTGSPKETSIAIAGFGNFLGSDITGFQAAYPYLAYNYTYYHIDGTPTCSKGETPPCATGETTEDIEYTIATSNSFGSANTTSHVYAYLGGNGNNATYTTLYGQILSDNTTRIMTTSWSCTEIYGCPETVMDARHTIFNSMVGEGWTLIAASGDRGATDDCNPAHIAVAFPGSDYDVLAAGGTQLNLNADGTWQSEQGWQGGTYATACSKYNDGGSGGGVSAYYQQPGWQAALSNLGAMRLVPDLSLNAAGIGENDFINGALSGNANGTSVVAPELAGFFAQENTYLNYIGNKCGSDGTSACTPIGNPAALIYAAGNTNDNAHNPFYDITTGCNSNDVTNDADPPLPFFCAGPGYDLVTGWGTANMMQLAWALNWQLIPANGVPSVSFTGPVTNHWYNTNQTVNWTIVDFSGNPKFPGTGIAGETQGWDSIPADPKTEPHGGTGNSFYSGPEFPDGSTGCLAFDANGCSGGAGQGCHTVHVEGWNNQGQATGDATYGPLCYDSVLPILTVTNTPSAPTSTGWYRGTVVVHLSAVDPGGTAASGVAQTYYGLDNAACTPTNLGACSKYTTQLSLSSQSVRPFTAFVLDKAGNVSTIANQIIAIDFTAPVTTLGLSGASSAGVWTNSVSVLLKATDNLSGVAATYYTLDGGSQVQYTGSFPISAVGAHTLVFWSVDNAGNTEKTNSDSFTIASSTTPTLTSSLNPSLLGQAVTLKAVVAATDAGTPTGTVTFVSGSTMLGTVTLASGAASLTASSLPAGSNGLAAIYNGATYYLSSVSATLTQVVHERTTTTLSSSQNPSPFGSALTLTASVKPYVSGTPTGTPTGVVQFYDGTDLLGSGTLSSSAVATFAVKTLAAGSNSITAVYTGDTTFTASTSAALREQISKAASAITLTSSVSPSAYGSAVGFTATVTSTAGTPAGTVTLSANGAAIGSATTVNGVATFTTKALSAGTNSITATYAGSADFLPSTSTALSEVITQVATTTRVVSSLNPSTSGASVTFKAAVVPAVTGTATGTVTFLANGTSMGTETLASGVASLTTTALAIGKNTVTVIYSGSTDYTASTSAALTETVNAAPTDRPETQRKQ